MEQSRTNRPLVEIKPSADTSGTATVRVAGDVDISSSEQLREALETSLAEPCRELALDLSSVGFMDSSGLHALVEGTQAFRAGGGVVSIHRPSKAVVRLLEITGLVRCFQLVK